MKEKIKKIDKQKFTTILLIVICALFVIGLTSYAVFSINLTGQSNIISKPAKVSLTYIEPEEALISDEFGLSVEEGKTQDSFFEFTVSATSETTFSIQYNIYITEEETNTLDREKIYMYLTEVVDNEEVEVFGPLKLTTFSSYHKYDNSYIIKSDWFPFETYTEETKSRTYRLRTWVDAEANAITNEDGSQSINIEDGTYEYKVSVDTFATPEYCFSYTTDETNKTATITDYLCYEENEYGYETITYVAIPDIINGYDITRIGSNSFKSKGLTGVAIPDSITYIEQYAFSTNNISGHVEIPESVTSIGNFAFEYNSIDNVELHYGIKNIYSAVFWHNSIQKVNFPESLKFIGNSAFRFNELTNVDIPNSVTSIISYAFANNNIESATLPENLTEISSYLFENNQLTSIKLPENITSIGSYAFSNNELTNIDIPDSVTTIGASAFSTNNLKSIELPENITSIEGSLFYKNNLTSIIIPENVISIGNNAFYENKLETIVVPNKVITIGHHAFYSNKLMKVTLGNSLESIGSYAFCTNRISDITLPESVKIIEEYAFWENELTSIKIKGKSSSSEFATYGESIWDWATGYSDSNITWNYSD